MLEACGKVFALVDAAEVKLPVYGEYLYLYLSQTSVIALNVYNEAERGLHQCWSAPLVFVLHFIQSARSASSAVMHIAQISHTPTLFCMPV